MKTIYAVIFILFFNLFAFGQPSWKELIKDGKSTKNEIIHSFQSEYPNIEKEYYQAMQKAAENNEDFFRTKNYARFKPYVRFERFKSRVLSKLNDNDQLSEYYNSYNTYSEYNVEKLKQKRQLILKSAPDEWKPLGPQGYAFTQGTVFGGGGRIDRLRFHPTNSATMYACSPGGGLWKTTDDGENGDPLTDFTGVTAVSDVLVHPENPNILYLATGDSDTWWMNGSIGVLKSVDGGQNWGKTGLEFPLSLYYTNYPHLKPHKAPNSILQYWSKLFSSYPHHRHSHKFLYLYRQINYRVVLGASINAESLHTVQYINSKNIIRYTSIGGGITDLVLSQIKLKLCLYRSLT